jgi:O-methyltransferase domain/Dimerisation domain
MSLPATTSTPVPAATSASGPSPEHILQVGLGFWASKTLLSAVEMEVFTELAKHPKDLEELRGRLGLHPRSARDFLDGLVALGFLERHEGIYSNTPATDMFLDKKKPSYIGGLLEMANHRSYGQWNTLTEGLRTGLPQNELKGGGAPVFETIYADPARLKEFLKAMTGVSHGANLAIAAKFPWANYRTVVDAGPAQGDLLVQVALQNQHLLGIGFDLAEVGPIFEEYVEANGLSSRVQFQAGSFFTDTLPEADVIMMGHILHDWNLDEKRILIDKAYKALPKGGALLVYDAIIDDDRSKNVFGLMMSLQMLIETHGGFDYTGADCIGWMKEAGFNHAHVEHLVGPDSMVIGIK